MVRTATGRLFCHVFINRNVKTKYFLADILFYRLKTADKIVVAENRMLTK